MDNWEPTPVPACCIGDCCGVGSYCCGHPDNNHEHKMCEQCNGTGEVSHMHYDGSETVYMCDICNGMGTPD